MVHGFDSICTEVLFMLSLVGVALYCESISDELASEAKRADVKTVIRN